MKEIINKARSFTYHSFQYDVPENPVFVKEESNSILVGENKENRIKCFWATNTIDHLISILDRTYSEFNNNEVMLEFVPPEFIDKLENVGFKIISEWVDFFIRDLNNTNLNYSLTCDIRRLEKDEISTASKITKSCIGLSREFYGEDEKTIKEWLTDKDSDIYVAVKDDQIVGICMMSVYDSNDDKVVWIRELAVTPNYQKQKIGRSLLIAGLNWGIKNGANKSFLATDVKNKHAINLYTKIGYKQNNGRGQINMAKEIKN